MMKKLFSVILAVLMLASMTQIVSAQEADLTIVDKAGLIEFAQAVNAGNTYEGKIVALGANIDLAGETWQGIGVYNVDAAGTPFSGTFDGAGHTISNVTFAVNKYTGLFNQLYEATVKNLTVEVDGFVEGATGYYGAAAIAGNAINSTIESCIAEGAITGTHNVAGIVVRIKDSTIKNCTNKAQLTNNYTKLGGIVNLCQDVQNSGNDGSVIDGCINEGKLTSTADGTSGVGGIIGWAGYYEGWITITDCENKGVIEVADTAVYGQIAGAVWINRTITGNKGLASLNMLATSHKATAGLNYATVDGNVATYVSDSALEAGKTYLVTAPGVKPSIKLKRLESVAFDTSIGTIADDSAVKAETQLITSTEDNITTYEADNSVAKVVASDDSVTYYDTLTEAINADDVVSIIVFMDNTISETDAKTAEDKEITFVLGEYTIEIPADYTWKSQKLIKRVAQVNETIYGSLQSAITAAAAAA